MEKSAEILSDITVFNKYAKYNFETKSRELLPDIVLRNTAMHIKKFPHMEDEIYWAFGYVLDKKVLPSMRAFQFAGNAAELNPARLYNCSYCAIDHIRSFSEAMFLLLSGCGFGYSVQKHHIDKLPELVGVNSNKHKRFLVSDDIEGWADAIKALIDSYFKGKTQLVFDYRGIRPKGTRLVTSGGKAPGPQPLKDCIHNIKKVLDTALDERGTHTKLKPIEAHDIICHIANAVMAGGIRRAACISLFSYDDDEMLNCKAGAWWELNPQRGRANNSVVLDRRKVEEENFYHIWERVKASGSGEPGIVFSNDPHNYGVNPCLPKWATVLTPKGLSTIGDIKIGDVIWSKEGWTNVINKWSTGVKDVYKYETSANRFYGTQNHEVVSEGIKVQAQDAESIDVLVGKPDTNSQEVVSDYYLASVMCGAKSFFFSKKEKMEEVQLNLNIHGYVSYYHMKDDGFVLFVDDSVYSSPVKYDEYISTEEVFDITVDNESHTFWSNGCDISNCAEISLKSCSFCNLTTVNVSDVDSQEEFENRVKAATIIGTIQASYTDFHYLRDVWRRNAESEALLGVSMTGIASNKIFDLDIKKASKYAVEVNKEIAKKIGINPAKRVTTVKPEGCQVKDTMVSTTDGILMLEEIGDCQSHEIWQNHDMNVYTDNGVKKSPRFYINGMAETNVITMDSGLVLEATNQHMYRVIDNGKYIWKHASDICVGDVVPYSIGEYNGGKYQELCHIEDTMYSCKQPKIIDEDLAWVLGLYTGDGSVHDKGIRIHGDFTKQTGFDRAIKIIKDKFGIDAYVYKYNNDENDKRCALYVNSVFLNKFLAANSLTKGKSKDIEIPLLIRKSPKNVILSFIDGYATADGCTKNKTRSFCTTSKTMAKQLPIILRSIGIDCKVRIMPPTDESYGSNMRYWIQERKGKTSKRNQTKWRKKAWDILEGIGFDNMSIDRVIDTRKNINMTYDIEVEDNHTFIANSYVSHNTASLVLGCSSGVHAYHAPYYIRRMRLNKDEALYKYLVNKMPELIEDEFFDPVHTAVLSVPIKSPDEAVMRTESPLDLLGRVKTLNKTWIRGGHVSGANMHNVSVTASIKEDEWDLVGAWMWENREFYNGISVLPADGGTYRQLPFEDCTEETYNEMFKYLEDVNLSEVIEETDNVEFKQEAACAGGACTIT